MKYLYLILLLTFSLNVAFAEVPYSLSQAKADMSASRYSTSIEHLRQLLDQEPNNYEGWFLLGVAHVHEQHPHQAIEAFRHVIVLRPELAEPHNNLAAVYNNLGDTKAAVAELETALEKRPNYSVAEENLADLYVKMALQHYRNALQQSPNPIIEQRYARLIKVRNPMPTAKEVDSNQVVASSVNKAKVVVSEDAEVQTPVEAPTEVKKLAKEDTMQVRHIAAADEQSITGVLDALERWRLAWSNQDLDGYFSAYADDYKPERRYGSVASWKAYKTRVIKNKKFIRVEFEQVEVDLKDDKSDATIMTLQRFRSNSYNGDDLKKIHFKYTDQGWKITTEASVQ